MNKITGRLLCGPSYKKKKMVCVRAYGTSARAVGQKCAAVSLESQKLVRICTKKPRALTTSKRRRRDEEDNDGANPSAFYFSRLRLITQVIFSSTLRLAHVVNHTEILQNRES